MLFEWIFQVANNFELKRETVYLTLYYIDKYLSVDKELSIEKF